MSKLNERLLERSIAHWKRMRDDPYCGEWPVADDCPLCRRYYMRRCRRCPICLFTDEPKCRATPYGAARKAWLDRAANPARWKARATAMIAFLRRVLARERARTRAAAKRRAAKKEKSNASRYDNLG